MQDQFVLVSFNPTLGYHVKQLSVLSITRAAIMFDNGASEYRVRKSMIGELLSCHNQYPHIVTIDSPRHIQRAVDQIRKHINNDLEIKAIQRAEAICIDTHIKSLASLNIITKSTTEVNHGKSLRSPQKQVG